MLAKLSRFKVLLEYLGGARQEMGASPPAFMQTWWWQGVWWGLLAGALLLFCGQTSKFIYIDF
jgi:hypothetical protein